LGQQHQRGDDDLEHGTVGLLYKLDFFGKTVRELVQSALTRAVLMLINSG
jgi:hypothetical protein